ncbi:hypothetical protein TNCT_405481 [Trichonephila clavata]|uniref:Uncharacterized protein n=1 Tax=Trichonephila clavata TaxID=2740835 RepID=A0A8X6G9L3_TRICU|nr:hypothetical protein TNCT_405481 [Trichonephila clavata]
MRITSPALFSNRKKTPSLRSRKKNQTVGNEPAESSARFSTASRFLDSQSIASVTRCDCSERGENKRKSGLLSPKLGISLGTSHGVIDEPQLPDIQLTRGDPWQCIINIPCNPGGATSTATMQSLIYITTGLLILISLQGNVKFFSVVI